MDSITLTYSEFNTLLESAAQRGAEIALREFSKPQLMDRGSTLEYLGIKAYSTLRKLEATPGFPMPTCGKYSRQQLEEWLIRKKGERERA